MLWVSLILIYFKNTFNGENISCIMLDVHELLITCITKLGKTQKYECRNVQTPFAFSHDPPWVRTQ